MPSIHQVPLTKVGVVNLHRCRSDQVRRFFPNSPCTEKERIGYLPTKPLKKYLHSRSYLYSYHAVYITWVYIFILNIFYYNFIFLWSLHFIANPPFTPGEVPQVTSSNACLSALERSRCSAAKKTICLFSLPIPGLSTSHPKVKRWDYFSIWLVFWRVGDNDSTLGWMGADYFVNHEIRIPRLNQSGFHGM